ncbi:MAG: response regulator [Vulcanimicrobiota bacterium]
MKKSIKLIIIEDQAILRESLACLLKTIPGFEVTGSWPDAEIALEQSVTGYADIALVDLHLRNINGIEFTSMARTRYPRLKVIILTVYDNEMMIHRALQAGAKGYIPKNASMDELTFAIRSVHQGQVFLSPALTERFIVWNRTHCNDKGSIHDDFPYEDVAMLRMARDGKSNKEIAKHLSIPVTKVKYKFSALMKKFDARDRTQCVLQAIRKGIIEMEECAYISSEPSGSTAENVKQR